MSRFSRSGEDLQPQATNEKGMDSTMTLVASDDQALQASAAEKRVPTALGGSMDNFLPTPPFNDFLDTFLPLSPEAMFAELASAATSPGTCAAQSSTIPAWTSNGGGGTSSATLPTSQGPLDALSFENFAQSQSHSRTSLPGLHDMRHHSADATINERPACDCFAACLQALFLLHNHSWTAPSAQQGGPPFDVVLSVTREAIGGGSAMLSCRTCVAKIGSGISTMLLATIFGKVMSLYRAACFFRFGAASRMLATAQLAFGSFTVTGEDRQLLEIEILLIELRKVENVLKVFQEKFDSSQAEKDETSVYTALTSYLEKNLYYIVEFLQARKQHLRGLSEVTPTGVCMNDGTLHDVDVLISENPPPGSEAWIPCIPRTYTEPRDTGSSERSAYLGIAVQGLPSLGLLCAPNTDLGCNGLMLQVGAPSFMYTCVLESRKTVMKLKRARQTLSLQPKVEVVKTYAEE
ncbi:MAG: hypothetical protein Q9173_003885, partial [Seirophora scorigena]